MNLVEVLIFSVAVALYCGFLGFVIGNWMAKEETCDFWNAEYKNDMCVKDNSIIHTF